MSGIVSTIAVVASVITGLTVIITAGIKVFKFIQKVTNKLEVLDKIEKTEKDRETIDKDFKSMEQGIKDIYVNLKDLNQRFSEHITKDTEKEKRADETLNLVKALNEASEQQRELLLQETRNSLLDKMEKALEQGYVDSAEEVDRIGDLFGAYSGYGGNHGVGAVYSQYKKLKIKGE